MDKRDPVLTVKCNEPEGEVVRSVVLCEMTVEKLEFYWEKLKSFKSLLNGDMAGNFVAFADKFIQQVGDSFVPLGLIWEVDDVGIFVLDEIIPGHSGRGHFTFWDRRFTGRIELCRQMLRYIMREFDLAKIRIEVPLNHIGTINAVEKIGLVKEGRVRMGVFVNDEWYDVNLYSILSYEPFVETNSKKNLSQICFECGETFKGGL